MTGWEGFVFIFIVCAAAVVVVYNVEQMIKRVRGDIRDVKNMINAMEDRIGKELRK